MSSPYGRRQPGYGRGEHQIEDAQSEAPQAAQLRAELVRIFGDRKYKPPILPAAAFELMEMSRRPDVDFRDVQSVVEKDVSIAGRVLQVAQSPLFATRVKAQTLRDAVQRLGINNIRDIVWQVSLDMRVFRAPGYDDVMTALQRHCVATAHLAQMVCGYTAVAGEYAFLCGLLHDIGASGILIALSEQKKAMHVDIDLLWPALEEIHQAASGYMVRLWKLDADLERIVSKHHDFDPDNMAHPLIAVVNIAEYLANKHGYGATSEPLSESLFDRLSERQLLNALTSLRLSEDMLQHMDAEAVQLLRKVG